MLTFVIEIEMDFILLQKQHINKNKSKTNEIFY